AVRTAGDGAEALALLALDGARIDVVVTDVDMPGLDGIEVCQRIKADATRHDIPVLILTGLSDETTLERAFAAGACDFIAKPIRPNHLLPRGRAAINLKHELDQLRARERELVLATDHLRPLNDALRRLSLLDDL